MSSRVVDPSAVREIPEIIGDPSKPHKKYERGKFLGKVSDV
jgi:hypothetical protein